MRFGLFFFAVEPREPEERLASVLRHSRWADEKGFEFVSTPERHFDPFGGIFPNPAVLSAAIAVQTKRVQIRAGSLVSPLHDTLRIVEDWALVDNLSRGRAAISFGSGWNVNDFALSPDVFAARRRVMVEQIAAVREMWRTGKAFRRNGAGVELELDLFPAPLQSDLPVWITSSGSAETFARAGQLGAGILTHLENQDIATLEEKIAVYRKAREEADGAAGPGCVTLMQHTFVCSDKAMRARAEDELFHYLGSALALESKAVAGGGQMSGQKIAPAHDLEHQARRDELARHAAAKYSHEYSLIGDFDTCALRVRRLEEAGVDEIACLVDFIEDDALLERALSELDRLRAEFDSDRIEEYRLEARDAFAGDGG
jgi:natural product biosynthesis luciferase-like monooxygenase protein